jgi:hypothetical protein
MAAGNAHLLLAGNPTSPQLSISGVAVVDHSDVDAHDYNLYNNLHKKLLPGDRPLGKQVDYGRQDQRDHQQQ